MNTDKDKLLRKIKKLLGLAKSNNPHEAAKALELAQKLMKEHQIHTVDVQVSEKHNKQRFSQKHARYISWLINVICRSFGVEAYTSNTINGELFGEHKMHVVFYGADERPLIASYCFDVLYRQLQQARKAFNASQSKRLKRATLIARADSFCEGWVRGVQQTVRDFALTDDEKSHLQQYYMKLSQKHNFQEATTRKAGDTRERNGDVSALQGYLQGKKAKISQAVDGQETAKLGVY